MAYDAELADRIRYLVGTGPGVTEKKMSGGLAFLIGGHMAISASGQGGALVRGRPGGVRRPRPEDNRHRGGHGRPGDAGMAARHLR